MEHAFDGKHFLGPDRFQGADQTPHPLFFNPKTQAYLRELAKEFDVSTNAVREELNQLKKTGLLNSAKNGRHILYMANDQHPLFPELKSMVAKAMGIDQVIDSIVARLGDLERAYLIDDYAEGKDTGPIDLHRRYSVDEGALKVIKH